MFFIWGRPFLILLFILVFLNIIFSSLKFLGDRGCINLSSINLALPLLCPHCPSQAFELPPPPFLHRIPPRLPFLLHFLLAENKDADPQSISALSTSEGSCSNYVDKFMTRPVFVVKQVKMYTTHLIRLCSLFQVFRHQLKLRLTLVGEERITTPRCVRSWPTICQQKNIPFQRDTKSRRSSRSKAPLQKPFSASTRLNTRA